MFGRRAPLFGQRKPTGGIPPHPGPDPDGVRRVIPMAVWDGPHGETLRQLGFTPDDPSNLMATPELMQARADAAKAEQDRFLERINSQLPEGVGVIPWAMIPWSLWSGPRAPFLLVVCKVFPTQPWNTFLMPQDERSAAVLGLPPHPRAPAGGLDEACTRLIGEVQEEYWSVFRPVEEAMAAGDMSKLSQLDEARGKACGDICGIAHALTGKLFGEDVYHRHHELFGASLGWQKTG